MAVHMIPSMYAITGYTPRQAFADEYISGAQPEPACSDRTYEQLGAVCSAGRVAIATTTAVAKASKSLKTFNITPGNP